MPTTRVSIIAGDRFARKVDRLKTAVRAQLRTRLPGTKGLARSSVHVDSALWERARSLATSRLGAQA
jgi:hypothetical protein